MTNNYIEYVKENSFTKKETFDDLFKILTTNIKIKTLCNEYDYVSLLNQFGFMTYGLPDDSPYLAKMEISPNLFNKYKTTHIVFVTSSITTCETYFFVLYLLSTYLAYCKDKPTLHFSYGIKTHNQVIRDRFRYKYGYKLVNELLLPEEDFIQTYTNLSNEYDNKVVVTTRLSCHYFVPHIFIDNRIKELNL